MSALLLILASFVPPVVLALAAIHFANAVLSPKPATRHRIIRNLDIRNPELHDFENL